MSRQRVEIHIEELVLHGFSPVDRYAVAEAVQRELAARLAEPVPPAAARDAQEPVHISRDAVDESLGRGIAVHISARIPR